MAGWNDIRQPHDPWDDEDLNPLRLAQELSGMVQPPNDPAVRAVETLFSVGPNVLNQLNRIGSPSEVPAWEQGLGYSDVMRNAGYEGLLAEALGLVGDLVEPGFGEFSAVANAAGGLLGFNLARRALSGTDEALEAGLSLANRVPYYREGAPTPHEIFRVEYPGGSGGPIARDLGLRQGNATYYGEPEYVEKWANRPGVLVHQGRVSAPAGSVLDLTGSPDPDLMARVSEVAARLLPPEQVDLFNRTFAEYTQGTSSAQDVIRLLRGQLGHDLGDLPREAGLSAIVQGADDGLNPKMVETVLYDRGAFRPTNVYTGDEFLTRQTGVYTSPQQAEEAWNSIPEIDPAQVFAEFDAARADAPDVLGQVSSFLSTAKPAEEVSSSAVLLQYQGVAPRFLPPYAEEEIARAMSGDLPGELDTLLRMREDLSAVSPSNPLSEAGIARNLAFIDAAILELERLLGR